MRLGRGRVIFYACKAREVELRQDQRRIDRVRHLQMVARTSDVAGGQHSGAGDVVHRGIGRVFVHQCCDQSDSVVDPPTFT